MRKLGRLMLTPAGIRTCLKGLAETAVFRKGFMYYAQQAVGPLSVSEPNKTQTVRIEASVSGNETYRPFLEFNTDTTKVVNTSCTCPSDGICKHIVALGLAYAHALEPLPSSRTSSQERTLTDEQFARRA